MEKTKGNPHPKCNFRPHTFAQSEHGCPLDHCGFCGGHVTDAEPCHDELVQNTHNAWRERCLNELFANWIKRGLPATKNPVGQLFEAFMFGVEGKDHEFHTYNLGDCGQDDCPSCHAEFEPYTGWDEGA